MNVLKNVLVVLRGSLVAQGISFAALPILARLYSPEDFGRYQVFQSVVGFLVLSASLRYEVAIVSAETDGYAFALAKLCLYINTTLAMLTLAICAGFHFIGPKLVANLGPALWLLPLAMIAGGAFQTLTFLLLRSHAFSQSSTARGVQALTNSTTALTLASLHLTGLGLIWADFSGRAVAIAYTYRRMISRDKRFAIWRNRDYSLNHLLRKFREYPLFSLPGSLVDGIAIAVTPILMFATFGPLTSGQYAVVDRSISLPLGVVTQAVSQVFMASFSSSLRTGTAGAAEIFKRVVLTHLKIGLVPAAVLFLWGPQLFSVVLGSQWREAGEFSRILAPLFLVTFLVSPVNMALLLLGKQRINLAWYVLRVTAILSAWGLILRFKMPPNQALQIHVLVNVAAYLLLLLVMYRSIVNHEASPQGLQT